jgi:hypothetical protein
MSGSSHRQCDEEIELEKAPMDVVNKTGCLEVGAHDPHTANTDTLPSWLPWQPTDGVTRCLAANESGQGPKIEQKQEHETRFQTPAFKLNPRPRPSSSRLLFPFHVTLFRRHRVLLPVLLYPFIYSAPRPRDIMFTALSLAEVDGVHLLRIWVPD